MATQEELNEQLKQQAVEYENEALIRDEVPMGSEVKFAGEVMEIMGEGSLGELR
ncbi:hypothetical protein [Psychrobacillus vulpis]|uniref:hypothetical protein n=1 Tax=Psychrobacillus vulpis TaxID=2325572 RepID=UPI00140B3A20|nr:hypothetical protein [Psychrobacillus vulpis]